MQKRYAIYLAILLPSAVIGTRTLCADPAAGKPQMPRIERPVLFNTLEADRILAALQVFPPDNPWNEDVSDWPIHPNSKNIIASIGLDKPLRYNADMGFVLVPPDQKKIEVEVKPYSEESDPGPYPVPDNLPIEGWPLSYPGKSLQEVQNQDEPVADRHGIVIDPVNGRLYEFYHVVRTRAGWQARQASLFDLKVNRLRPDGWTSSDAAGLPVFPAIVRYDELKRGRVEHALRVTVRRSRKAHVYPARHDASRLTDPNLPRMGERLRLRLDYDLSGFSQQVKTILEALKKHGMFVADNGLDWAISVAPDERIANMHEELRRIKGSAFEVIQKSGR
jgi:hypothetical protein